MKSEQQPFVSIIIPTYHRTQFLKLTLESINKQSYQHFEILVIDDGSVGDENKILCSLFNKVYYQKINNSGGPAKPRNIGIQLAKGKYIAFVDDDDIWLPNKLAIQVETLEHNLDYGLVHSCCDVIDSYGVMQNYIIGRPGKPAVKHGDVAMRMMGNWTVMMPTSFVRKEIVDKVGFFNEKIPAALEDVEYWTRCSFETKFYYIDKPLVQYRVHSKNISANSKLYIDLPLYLKKVLEQQLVNGKIDSLKFQVLLDNLCLMQIKNIRTNFFRTISNLFQLQKLWFLKYRFLKSIIAKLLYLKKIKYNIYKYNNSIKIRL